MCHETDTELVLAWNESNGKHLRCKDHVGCVTRLLRASNIVELHPRRYGPDLEAA